MRLRVTELILCCFLIAPASAFLSVGLDFHRRGPTIAHHNGYSYVFAAYTDRHSDFGSLCLSVDGVNVRSSTALDAFNNSDDLFVAKIDDVFGRVIWAISLNASTIENFPVYVLSALKIVPGPKSLVLVGASKGMALLGGLRVSSGYFLAGIDERNGSLLWTRTLGSQHSIKEVTDVAGDPVTGSIYMIAQCETAGEAFGGWKIPCSTEQGSFIAKFSAEGKPLWHKMRKMDYGIAVDHSGAAYVASDTKVTKLDKYGTVLWDTQVMNGRNSFFRIGVAPNGNNVVLFGKADTYSNNLFVLTTPETMITPAIGYTDRLFAVSLSENGEVLSAAVVVDCPSMVVANSPLHHWCHADNGFEWRTQSSVVVAKNGGVFLSSTSGNGASIGFGNHGLWANNSYIFYTIKMDPSVSTVEWIATADCPSVGDSDDSLRFRACQVSEVSADNGRLWISGRVPRQTHYVDFGAGAIAYSNTSGPNMFAAQLTSSGRAEWVTLASPCIEDTNSSTDMTWMYVSIASALVLLCCCFCWCRARRGRFRAETYSALAKEAELRALQEQREAVQNTLHQPGGTPPWGLYAPPPIAPVGTNALMQPQVTQQPSRPAYQPQVISNPRPDPRSDPRKLRSILRR